MKVLVAHPHRLVGGGLACILAAQGKYEVISICTTTEDAAAKAAENSPAIVVTSGLFIETGSDSYVTSLKDAAPSTGIIVVSSPPSSEDLSRLLALGISGYVSIDSSTAQLIDAVRRVSAGEIVLSGIERKAMTATSEASAGQSRKVPVEKLTPREREVLQLLSQGFSNRQIAEDLYLSEHTVRTHVQNLRSKLNVRSKFEAAMISMRSGGVEELASRNAMRF